MKMSMSEAGRLGYLKNKDCMLNHVKEQKEKALLKNKDNKCKNCNKEISYEKRRNKFCSKSCAASFNNNYRSKNINRNKNINKSKNNCLYCNKEIKNKKFCSIKCFAKYYSEKRKKELIDSGNLGNQNRIIRNILIDFYGNKCSICRLDGKWQDKELVLIVDHIDGNSENTQIDNFRLVCPNCDSQLPTYKGRNTGKGRFKRRERYKEGKSY